MKIILEFSGAIRRPFPENEKEMEAAKGASVKTLLTDLGYTEKELRFLVAFRDEKKIKLEEPLSDGDRVKVLIPIGGG